LRFGYKRLLLIGNAILVCSGAWFLMLSQATGFWFVFCGSILLGLAFGLSSTVTIIGSQQLVESTQKGISTSLQMFSRNIGTAVGVTLMGAFVTQSAVMLSGFHYMFIYGFAVSLIALLSACFVRDQREPVTARAERA